MSEPDWTIDDLVAAVGPYADRPVYDPRLDLPLPEQVRILIDLAADTNPGRAFRRTVPVNPRDHDEVLTAALGKLVVEVRRLRTDNDALRGQCAMDDEGHRRVCGPAIEERDALRARVTELEAEAAAWKECASRYQRDLLGRGQIDDLDPWDRLKFALATAEAERDDLSDEVEQAWPDAVLAVEAERDALRAQLAEAADYAAFLGGQSERIGAPIDLRRRLAELRELLAPRNALVAPDPTSPTDTGDTT